MSSNLVKLVADFETQLAAPVSVGATTGSLASILDDDGNNIPNGLYGLTIDNGSSVKEFIVCTNTAGALTNVFSVSRQGVLSAGFARAHRRGASVIISDWRALKAIQNLLDGTDGFDSATKIGYDADPGLTGADLTKFATVKYVNDTATAGAPDASTTTKGITKLSTAPVSPTNPIAVGDNDTRVPTQGENDALVGTAGTPSSTNKYVTNDDTSGTGLVVRSSLLTSTVANVVKFGGDGSDGALAISSGTTTINLGGVAVVVKNYTSIAITGTGVLAFSNPHASGTVVILRSQGVVTLTSSATPMLDGTGIGATTTTNATNILDALTHNGAVGTVPTGGAAGVAYNPTYLYTETAEKIVSFNHRLLTPGSGGGAGSTTAAATGTPGQGGRGGGAILVECGGALNFTTAGGISVGGSNGGNGSAGSGAQGGGGGGGAAIISNLGTAGSTSTGAPGNLGAGGGGGGAGGMFVLLYNSVTANTGTVTVTGGTGGNGGDTNNSNIGGNGATGYSLVAKNTMFA